MPDLFLEPKLKVRRAAAHYEELAREVAAYWRLNPIILSFESDVMGRNPGWVFRIRHPYPMYISTIVGDMIHNLRSALDILSCDLVILAGENDRKASFPFSENIGELNRKIRESKIGKSGSECIEIIRSLKPYKDGNEDLWSIHDIDIRDKHRMLMPSCSLLKSPNFFLPQFNLIVNVTSTEITDGGVFGHISGIATPKIGDILENHPLMGNFELIFPKNYPLKGKSLLPKLLDLSNVVKEVISKFDNHFSNCNL